MPSSTPLIALDLALDVRRRAARASATTSMVWRVFSSTGSVDASKSTEFQPVSQAVGDHLALRAVVQVQRDRDRDVGGHRRPHRVEHVGADRLAPS